MRSKNAKYNYLNLIQNLKLYPYMDRAFIICIFGIIVIITPYEGVQISV